MTELELRRKEETMNEEFVVGFVSDEPDGLTPIDIVMDVTGLSYEEVKSCCEVVKIDDDVTLEI